VHPVAHVTLKHCCERRIVVLIHCYMWWAVLRWSLGQYSSLTDSDHGVSFVLFWWAVLLIHTKLLLQFQHHCHSLLQVTIPDILQLIPPISQAYCSSLCTVFTQVLLYCSLLFVLVHRPYKKCVIIPDASYKVIEFFSNLPNPSSHTRPWG
jgi:hypothetical protein